MKKIGICLLVACMALVLFVDVNNVDAVDFAGNEKYYTDLCSSSSLSSSNESVCKSFNAYLKEKNNALKKDIANTKKELEETKGDLSKIESVIKEIANQIQDKQSEIDYFTTYIENLEVQIEEKETEIKDRMYAMQSTVNSNRFVQFLFGAADFTEMFSRIDMVNTLTEYDTNLMREIEASKKEVESQKETVELAKANLEAQKAEQDTYKAEYLAVLSKQSDILADQNAAQKEIEESNGQISQALADLAERSKETEIPSGGVSVTGDSEVGKAIVNAALTKLGKPYTWCAQGPNTFDCSGLVYWAHRQAGVSIPRESARHYANRGKSISFSETQAGDVVTFFGYGYVCHIGILMDDKGTVLHASGQANEIAGQWGGKVRINNQYQIGLQVYNYRRLY